MHSNAAYVVQELALYSMDIKRAFTVAGAIPPLVELLSSSSSSFSGVQGNAAGALRNMGVNVVNQITIATAGERRVLFRP